MDVMNIRFAEVARVAGVQGPLLQGDLRTYTLAATVDYATYLTDGLEYPLCWRGQCFPHC